MSYAFFKSIPLKHFFFAPTVPSSVVVLYQSVISSGRVLPPEYYKNIYDQNHKDYYNNSATTSSKTPWNIGGGRPQPAIVNAYKEGKIRGKILDAGCGAGENCLYLATKFEITSVFGFDLAEGAIKEASERAANIDRSNLASFTEPHFLVASCTEIVEKLKNDSYSDHFRNGNETNEDLFDVSIDSGLLHCLCDDDAERYVKQLSHLVKPNSGRVFVGCFSTANPDPWDNPRRLSRQYLQNIFCERNGWEIISITDIWWARPPSRGSSQGAFSMALWMEARVEQSCKEQFER